MLETRGHSSFLIHKINEHYPLTHELEEKIREFMHESFKRGYEDCLKDVREGLIR